MILLQDIRFETPLFLKLRNLHNQEKRLLLLVLIWVQYSYMKQKEHRFHIYWFYPTFCFIWICRLFRDLPALFNIKVMFRHTRSHWKPLWRACIERSLYKVLCGPVRSAITKCRVYEEPFSSLICIFFSSSWTISMPIIGSWNFLHL